MYLAPGGQLWLDVWIPRDDPLWVVDVSAAAEWVGAWWTAALAGVGQHGFEVHRGRSVPGDVRRPRVLRRPRTGRGVPGRPQGGRVCRSGGRGRGPCSPRAPTCAGTRRRCWRCSTWDRTFAASWRAAWRSAAAGLADLSPAAGLGRTCGPGCFVHSPTFAVTGPPAPEAPGSFPSPPSPLFSLPSPSPLLPLLASRVGRAAPGRGRRNAPAEELGEPVGGRLRRRPGSPGRPGGFSCVAVGRGGCEVGEKGLKWRGVV